MYDTDPTTCDKCPAMSAVRLMLPRSGGELQFCNHHYLEVSDALFLQGWHITQGAEVSSTTATDAAAFADVVSTLERSGFTGPSTTE